MIAGENFASDSYEKSQHCVRTIIWMHVDFVVADAIVSVLTHANVCQYIVKSCTRGDY